MLLKNRLLLSSCMALILTPVTLLTAQAETQFPANAKDTCVVSEDEFRKQWLNLEPNSAGSTSLTASTSPFYDKDSGLVYVFPPNGPAFVGGSDCHFYKWSSRMFLWLTSSVNDTASTPPTNPTPPDDETRYVFSSEFIYNVATQSSEKQTETGYTYKLAAQGLENSSGVQVRTSKLTEADVLPIDAEGNAQAGGSGVLLSQSNSLTNGSSLTYFGLQTNRVYGYYLNNSTNVAGNPSTFPTTSGEVCPLIKYAQDNGYASDSEISTVLYDYYCNGGGLEADDLTAVAGGSGATNIIPKLETGIDYLSLALELKTSWVDASTLKNPGRYIRQMGDVPKYTQTSATEWTNTGETEQKELAMVGMHIVGSAKGHPELIWATIEHVDNAPNYPYSYIESDGSIAAIDETATKTDWLFSNGSKVTDSSGNAVTNLTETIKVDSSGNIVGISGATIEATNVNRINPWGSIQKTDGTTATSSETNNTMLISLNNSIRGLLLETSLAEDAAELKEFQDPRFNYFLSGAVWTNNGVIPTFNDDSDVTGSVTLANSTMETYQQDTGCFGCHSANNTSEPTGTSHIFGSINPDLPSAGNN